MTVPAGIAAEAGALRQNIALSVIKQSAEADQQLVKILEDTARSAPLSQTRGTNVNLLA